MTITELKSLLTSNFIEKYKISINTPYVIEEVDPRILLSPERLDIIAKITYIDFKERNLKSDFGVQVYKKHIDAFSLGTNSEPGDPDKNTIEDYIDAFDKIIKDIKDNGFDASKSLVPVDSNNIALNGAHRIAACIYFKKPIKVVRFNFRAAGCDYNFFLKRGLDRSIADYLATKYCELKPNTFAMCVWPKAYSVDKFRQADHHIHENKEVKVVYKKSLNMSFNSLLNLLLQIYGHDDWTGDYTNGFKGADVKVNYVYTKTPKLQFYILEAASLETITRLKQRIRSAYNIGNDSVHSTDNQRQTLQIARLLLNQQSLHHLEHATVSKYKNTHQYLDEFKQAVSDKHYDTNNFVIDSGSVLSIYGIRPSDDFDFLSPIPIGTLGKSIEQHSPEESPHIIPVDDLIHNPMHHFYFQDVKFISLHNVLLMKKERRQEKDKQDIKLIHPYIGGNKGISFYIARSQAQLSRRRTKAIIFIGDRLDSIGLKKPIKKIVKSAKNIRR